MRIFLIPIVAFASIAATGETEIETLRPDPPLKKGEVLERFKDILEGNTFDGFDGKQVTLSEVLRSGCRDRLDYAEDGKPDIPIYTGQLLRRGPSTPEQPPLAIYAVDRREYGCGVMVMMGDPNDVRPLPELDADDHRLMPADALNGD